MDISKLAELQFNLNFFTDERYFDKKYFESDLLSLLFLMGLYHNGLINKCSFTQRASKYDKRLWGGVWKYQTINRKLNTYYSKVLDEWFEDVELVEVLVMEVIHHKDTHNFKIDYSTLIEYFQLALGKKHNYWVYHLNEMFFKVIQDNVSFNHDYWDINHKLFNLIDNNEIKAEELRMDYFEEFSEYCGVGYCCEDCDGDYVEYITHQFNNDYIPSKLKYYNKIINKMIKKLLK